jgi:mRNA interferase MazF
VFLKKQSTGLSRDSVANVSQMFTIYKSFLATPISRLSPAEMGQVEDGLRLVLNL